MKKILAAVAATIALTAAAQSDNKIVIGKIDTVYSKILGEQRKIWVYTPGMTAPMREPGKRYPVLYLLDGDTHFASVVGLVQQLSQANGNAVLPEMIIVGIPNTNRRRDLTPTRITNDPMMDSASSTATGGGEKFAAFMEKELIPRIDSLYPTAPYRLLVGHSFGGLTVMNVLTNHTKMFNAYIAIDPSMWYDKERFLAATKQKLSGQKYDGIRLYMGIANTMPAGMVLEKMKKDTTADTRHIRSIFQLDKFIKATPQNGLKYASRYYSDDNHSSVPLASEYDGLRFIFSYYRFSLAGNDLSDSTDAFAVKLAKYYAILSKEMGYKISSPELSVNALGYDALSKKYYKRAAAFFEMNIANYPGSSNVYDSYGDYFTAKKDTADAIRNYKKALAIQNNAATIQKLNKLESKHAFTLSEDELQKYAGAYDIEGVAVTVTLWVKNGMLGATVPGEADIQLVPLSPGVFTVKNQSGYTITFEEQAGKIAGFTSIQPNGTFKAHIKK